MQEQKERTKMKRIARFALFGAVGFGIGGLFSGPTSLFGFAIVLNPGWNPGWLWAVIGFAVWGFGFAVKGALGGTALGLALRKGRRLTATLALFGAIGFLVGGYLFLLFLGSGPRGMFPWVPWGIVLWALGGAIGGTALGLALRKGRRIIAALTLFGAIGFLVVGSLFAFLMSWGMLPTVSSGIGLLDGPLGGAVLGLAFRDRRKIIGLALAGALGFWIGLVIANYLQHWLEFGELLLAVIKFSLQSSLGGIIGGASLGAALGYLEKRRVAKESRTS